MDERRTDRAYASFLRRFPTRLSQRCSPIRHSPYGAHAVKHVVETTEVAGQSPNWLLTRLDDLVNWARANSLWPMPFGTACCAIEFMATAASRFDFARFGMERQAFSPPQADVLIFAGRLPLKLAPGIRRVGDQVPPPKVVNSLAAYESAGGMFDKYAAVE